MAAIRVLHFADVHLGVENYGRLDPSTGLNSRLLDFAACLDHVIGRALRGDVDLVVFAGDAYRSRDPSPTHQREFARQIRRLSAAGIPVFLLVGNHDLPIASGRANTIDIFDTLQVPKIHVARSIGVTRVPTRKGEVQVVALPWVARSRTLVKDEYRELSLDEARRKLEDQLAAGIGALLDGLDPEPISILVGHLTVAGAVYGSERNVLVGDDFVLPASVVCAPPLDYVALGHIHRHQIVNQHPLGIYAGSIERIDFGEEREEKGYVVADVEKGGASYTFEPVAARRFLTIDVKADREEPTRAILEAIGRHDLTDRVVRLRIETTPEREASIDLGEVRRALRGASYVAGVQKRVERADRSRAGAERVAEMSEREALEAYLRSKSVSPERARRLLELGDELIRRPA